MKRSAILIAASSLGMEKTNFICALWKKYLMSCVGGLWEPSEIVCPESTVSEVLDAVKNVEADYSVVVFIGHGTQVKENRPWKETRIRLNDAETLLAECQLNTGAPRLTIVLDCCRSLAGMSPFVQELKFSEETLDKSKQVMIRNTYDIVLQRAEKGVVKIVPTSMSGDVFDGSSFSSQLLETAMDWGRQHRVDSVATWNDAVKEFHGNNRSSSVCEKSGFAYQGGRRMKHFPFAVGIVPQELV